MRRFMFIFLLLFTAGAASALVVPRAAWRPHHRMTAYERRDQNGNLAVWVAHWQNGPNLIWQAPADSIKVTPATLPDSIVGYGDPVIFWWAGQPYVFCIAYKDTAYLTDFCLFTSTDGGYTWTELWESLLKQQSIARNLRGMERNGLLHIVWEDCRTGVWQAHYRCLPLY